MRRAIKKMQESTGFISIEAVILWGLMIALGAWAWTRFYALSEEVVENAVVISSTPDEVKVTNP